MRRRALCASALALPPGLRAQPGGRPLVLVVDSATDLPNARIEHDRVVGGLTLELAQLLAARMGVETVAISRPRRRLLQSLLDGEADWVCSYMAAWLPGPLRWSQGFFEHEEVVATRADHPAPRQLQDLAGQRLGTILGFVYPEVEAALGRDFLREDAPNAEANLRKLVAGRVAHALVSQRLLQYHRLQGRVPIALHPPLLVHRYRTQCALGPKASVSLEQLNRAIEQVQRDGSLQALTQRYAAAEPSTRSSSRP